MGVMSMNIIDKIARTLNVSSAWVESHATSVPEAFLVNDHNTQWVFDRSGNFASVEFVGSDTDNVVDADFDWGGWYDSI